MAAVTLELPDALLDRLRDTARDEGRVSVEALLRDLAEQRDAVERRLDEQRDSVSELLRERQASTDPGRPATEVFDRLRRKHGLPERS
ncbi:MAG: ribbon-helix-helix protein, CopG family [Planctomycetota bacterium]